MKKKKTKKACKGEGSWPAKRGKTVTRKIRKQVRRAKSREGKTAKKTRQSRKKIDSIAQAIADSFSQKPSEKKYWGLLFYCKMFGCKGYGGGDAWCHECRFYPCLKVTKPQDPLLMQICRPCSWDNSDRRRACC